MKDVDFEELKGKTFDKIEVGETDEDITFYCTKENIKYKLSHPQDCCESVYIEDICGDLDDLLNTEILAASEETKEDKDTNDELSGWTFYHLRTIKGTVTLRWYGSSNGYYSISVFTHKGPIT